MNSKSTVLVTGGAGFIGSHLCERLVGNGHRVVCIDNMLTGRVENLEPLRNDPRFLLIERDVTQPVPPKLRAHRIFHLACPASPPSYQANPLHTMLTCVVGANNYLKLASQCRARFLLSSTSEVYGDPEVHPQAETYCGAVNTTGPRACYDEGKRAAETLASDYHRFRNVDVRIARIFNTYGPRMREDDGRVISNFIVQAIRGEPLTIYGDGSHTRSFCYVDDMVAGLLALMESETAGPLPVNLGNPAEYTIRELANIVLEMSGSDSPVRHEPLPQDDPKRRQPVITRAKAHLGWSPHTPLRLGLERTMASFLDRRRKLATPHRRHDTAIPAE